MNTIRGLEVRKVTVSIPEVHMSYITLEVDDNDDDQAMKEKANLLLESGDYQDNLEYSHTMDMDMWDVTVDNNSTYHKCLCDIMQFQRVK
jgi:hypothetical protein